MTEAIQRALAELKGRLGVPGQLMEFLERSVWPKVVPGALGRPITKQKDSFWLKPSPR